MRPIKFRFRIKFDREKPKFVYYTLWKIIAGLTILDHRLVKILSRDLFVGPKDKNKKEIFEGDIIKSEGENWEVKFEKYGIEPFNNFGHCCHMAPHFDDEKPFEVIGNIYENPELLKGKNGGSG